MMLKRLVPLVLLPILTCACATPPAVGQHAEVSGKLVLRGNEPFVTPVVYDASGPWEIEGMSHEDAARLQNTTVSVDGDVTRVDTGGAQLPALRMHALKTLP